jgi:serine protease AprX
MKRYRFLSAALTACAILTSFTVSLDAAVIGPSLAAKLQQAASSVDVGMVIVSFNTNNGLQPSHMAALTAAGVTKGFTLQHLGMVAFPATAAQVKTLSSHPAVRSIWANDRLKYLNNETRVLTGVDKARTDSNFIRYNKGMPITGAGVTVVVNDSGIDGTHPDLQFPNHVIQNVQALTDSATLSGFTSLTFAENIPDTDLNVGHGTHCAGIIAGTGAASGGLYAGVAPGANLVGVGSGVGLFVLNSLGGFEYTLANQARFNIRIISNSWGGNGPYDPSDPISIAAKEAHDLNIVVVFAAGNSGPGKDTMNPYAKAPYVIGVAAGTKEGGLASFSSRGVPKSTRAADDYNAPTITAPGTGREFASDAAKFTSDIVSTRAKTNLVANGEASGADVELPTSALPWYTEISGTSMATPFVAGAAALMLQVQPTLTPDQIKQIMVDTASQMPGFSEFEVGAGYLNVYAALDKVINPSKKYGTYRGAMDLRNYNEKFNVTGPAAQAFHVDYSPAATPGPGSANAVNFTVEPGMSVLDIMANIGDLLDSGTGNTVGIIAYDPNGVSYSSGIALPILDATTREVLVNNPIPGQWRLEVHGVRGLAAVPEVSLPTTGAALAGPVDGTIAQQKYVLQPVPDIQGIAAQPQIEYALKNRLMDVFADGSFHPNLNVTRQDFAQTLVLDTALRQNLGASKRFTDTSAEFEPIAEAVSAKGSTLRDYDFTPSGMISVTGSSFYPATNITRMALAMALVKALGHDADAQAKAGSDVTANYNGTAMVVADNAQIPASLRGYVQLALDRGILQAYFTMHQGATDLQPTVTASVRPGDPVTRAWLAYALANYQVAFSTGN